MGTSPFLALSKESASPGDLAANTIPSPAPRSNFKGGKQKTNPHQGTLIPGEQGVSLICKGEEGTGPGQGFYQDLYGGVRGI